MSQAKQAEYAMELELAEVCRVRAGESVRAVAEELGGRYIRLFAGGCHEDFLGARHA